MTAATGDGPDPPPRCGVVALAGRPNVGKSTLVNAVVGEKVAIVSGKPQTTRRAIRGVVTGPGWQIVLVDLPGVQRPRDRLTHRMQAAVRRGIADADAILLIVDGADGVGPGDRFIARALSAGGDRAAPVVVAVNKIDRLRNRPAVAAALLDAEGLERLCVPFSGIFPVSARTGAGLGALVDCLAGFAPEGPALFPEGERTDQPEAVRIAELVREQVVARTRQEVPHAVEVFVDEIDRRRGLAVVRARIWVESPSQRAIVVGAGGSTVRAIGTAARPGIERLVGEHVHLELRVTVEKGWRQSDALLDRLGLGP